MRTDKIQTGIRFKNEMLQKITYIAQAEHRSLNAQMEHITQQFINEYEAKHGEIYIQPQRVKKNPDKEN